MLNMHKEIVITADGSPTLFIPELKEHYHSVNGAMQESVFVYIENALNLVKKTRIKLFELGFGTGLNAYLSCLEADRRKVYIVYHSIEINPIEKNEWMLLSKFFQTNQQNADLFQIIHECEWEKKEKISHFFSLKKIKADIEVYETHEKYDVIYFDAFGPEVQKEMWEPEIFNKISNMMNQGAILSTYSSKGLVGRNMGSAGLKVKRIPGPPGKREIIVASKPFFDSLPLNF